MTPAVQLIETLGGLRRQWRQRVLLEAVVWIAIAMLVSILAGQLITSVFGSTSSTVMFMRGIGYVLVLGVLVRYLVQPLLKRTSDERFALYVEERAPALRQSLLSAVHELHAPAWERASPSLTARLMDRTLALMTPLRRDRALERPRVLRAMRSLGVMIVVVILMVTIGPRQLRHTARQIFAPWSVAEAATPTLAVRVLPGNAAIPRGAAVDVKATLDGFAADGAELVFRSDSSAQWVRLPMARDSVAGTFTSRVFDLTHATEYFVDANGIRSPTYTLRVTDLPALSGLAIDLRFPAYTGLAAEHIKEGGDVAAVVGTVVTIHATITKPARGGVLAFDNGSRIALAVGADGLLSASFPVKTTGFYRVDLVAPDGVNVPGSVQYAVEALPDRPPTVKIVEPGRDTKVTNIEEVTVAVSATDDYGVESLVLRYRVNGGDEHSVALSDSGPRHQMDARATHTFFLEELKLVPGDLITYHAVARDGAGHEGVSDVYFLEVRPFGKNYRQSEQQGGGGGAGGDSPDGFVARQREIVAGTFNWIRDSTTTSPRVHREDIATLNIAEGRLREEVGALARRIAERGAARTDTTFTLIQRELEEGVKGLQDAEAKLVKSQGKEALPLEQQALTRLQRAEELYRNVQVQMGGGSGGGGGGEGAKKAEELADLFELQTDKLHNQYEAVQQASQQQATREVDATLERLKQLAARQQQENERVQKLAEAMREKLGRQQGAGGGGGGGSQRDLAKQAEEEARKLERLAREQKSQELSDAAQQMQQAADAMKRAATGASAQGNAALEQLSRASRGLEGARSAAMTESVRKLSQQAKDLQDREQEILEGLKALTTATANQRGEQVRVLTEKKDALAKDVDKLEAAADRAAREGRRDQPAAASKVGDAANAIRDQRVRDKIDFSKNVLRGGSIDYANAFEGQIGENLKDVADKMRSAAGALSGESATRAQEKTLDRARELVKGLESLRQRVGDRTGQGAAQSAQSAKAAGQQKGQQGQGSQGGQGGRGEQQSSSARTGQTRGGGGPPGSAPAGISASDARQLSREFALRRQNAEALRGELQKQGVTTGELDRAINELRRLENSPLTGDPQGIDQLQASVIDGLKTFEFSLYRRLGLGDSKSPMLGSHAAVPAEYRAAVEEYYRSLAGARDKP